MTQYKNMDLVHKKQVIPLILWFLTLTAIFSLPLYWLEIKMGMAYLYLFTSMWIPGLAALAACRIMKVTISILGFNWGDSKAMLLCYLLPLMYFSVIYGITWLGGLAEFFNYGYMNKIGDKLGLYGWTEFEIALLALPMTAVFMLPQQLASATGEEIGWRGLLAPQLMRLMTFPMASITSGLIWFLWHVPIIVWGNYMTDERSESWQILWYAIMLICLSFPMLYYRLKTNSLWSAAILHASHNLFLIYIFMRLTNPLKTTNYYAGEWGSITATTMVFVAALYWYKARKEGFSDRIIIE